MTDRHLSVTYKEVSDRGVGLPSYDGRFITPHLKVCWSDFDGKLFIGIVIRRSLPWQLKVIVRDLWPLIGEKIRDVSSLGLGLS